MATSIEVARLAGVSQATVSRAISRPEAVSEKTRKRVIQAMNTLGYVPHHGAQVLRGGRTNTVGIVVSDLLNPFYPQVLNDLTRELDRRGFQTVIWNGDLPNHGSALEAIRRRSIDGVVFVAATPDSNELATAVDSGSPVVLINRDVPGIDCDRVLSDNQGGASLVANFLRSHGRCDAAFVGGSPETSTAAERELHFLAKMKDLGAAIPYHRRFNAGFKWHLARDIVKDLVESLDPPKAIFCANDFMALGALDAVKSSRVAAAEDCWIIGFDDIPLASWASIGLTTVHQPIHEMVARAADLLVQRIDEPQMPFIREVYECSLRVRGSTPLESDTP